MNKYSEDFGEAIKEISEDENPDPVDLYYYIKELSSLGTAINEGKFSEKYIELVFENEGITKDVLQKIVDKFLIYIDLELQKIDLELQKNECK